MKKSLTKFLALLGVFLFLGAGNAWAQTWYLRGVVAGNNGWNEDNKIFQFTRVNDNQFQLHLNRLYGEFKFKSGNNWYGASSKHNGSSLGINSASDDNFSCSSNLQDVTITLNVNTKNELQSVSFSGTQKSSSDNFNEDGTVYIFGDFNGVRSWDANDNSINYAIPLTPDNTRKVWTGLVAFDSDNDVHFKFRQYNDIYGVNSNTNKEISPNTSYTAKAKDQTSGAFKLPSGIYKVTFTLPNGSGFDGTVKFEYPDQVSIYGQLNNSYWVVGNHEPMTVADKSKGIYKASKININGIWGERDLGQGVGRTLNGDTKNENYISFFAHEVTDMDNMGHRFGSIPDGQYGNVEVAPNGTTPVKKDIQITDEIYSDNFMVAEGVYDIELNLSEKYVVFTKIIEHNVDFVWYDDAVKLNDQDNHGFQIDDGRDHIIEVGVSNNLLHKVAKQVDYEVWYREPNYFSTLSNGKFVRTLADDNAPDYASQGYTLIESYDGDDVFDREGSNDLSSNHQIQLLKAGDYVIIASLDKSRAQNVDNYNVDPNTLMITVAQAAITLSNEAPTPQPFNNSSKSQYTFTHSISTSNVTLSDVTWSFGPKVDTWPTTYEGVTQNLIDQKNELGDTYLIDGVFTELTEDQYSLELSEGTFTLTLNKMPCSGMYQLTIGAKESGNYSFDPVNIDIEIYPTILNIYEASSQNDKVEGGVLKTKAAFNVNGIPLTSVSGTTGADYAATIQYPYLNGKLVFGDYLDVSRVYYPGLYLADVYLYYAGMPADAVKDDPESQNARRKVASRPEGYVSYNSNQTFDLEALKNGGINLYVFVSKNGASTPVENGKSEENVFIDPSTSALIPTAVEAIGAEEGEAVYYNLQGVRVDNPEHGIYVKVVNGKASKVVL